MDQKLQQPNASYPVQGLTLDKWCQAVGRSDSTAYRWIKLGMLEPVNIMGKLYVTADDDTRFWARAKAGEFEGETVSVKDKVSAQSPVE